MRFKTRPSLASRWDRLMVAVEWEWAPAVIFRWRVLGRAASSALVEDCSGGTGARTRAGRRHRGARDVMEGTSRGTTQVGVGQAGPGHTQPHPPRPPHCFGLWRRSCRRPSSVPVCGTCAPLRQQHPHAGGWAGRCVCTHIRVLRHTQARQVAAASHLIGLNEVPHVLLHLDKCAPHLRQVDGQVHGLRARGAR